MKLRTISTGIADTLAFGMGFRKVDGEGLDRPMAYNEDQRDVLSNVIDFREEATRVDKLAPASVYFYSNMRVLSQKCGVAELFVKIREGERTEPVEDHPFEQLLRRPNVLFSLPDLIEHSIWWLGLNGNAYWYLTTNGAGELAELWPLPASDVRAVPDKERVIKEYRWKPRNKDLPPIPVEKICHFRMVNPFSVINGMSFLKALEFALRGSEARFQWELDFFSDQRAVPEGLLSVDPATSVDDVKMIRDQLVEEYGQGKRKIAVGRSGMIDFTRFQLTQEEMAFLERLQYDEKLFDRVFGFPGGYWDAKANRSNAEQAERSLAQDTVMPLLGKLAGNIEVQILDRYYEDEAGGENLVCEFEDITPEDREQTVAEFEAYKDTLTFNEARALAGYGAVDEPLGSTPYALLPALVQMISQGYEPMPAVETKTLLSLTVEDDNKATDDLRKWQQVALREFAKGKAPGIRPFYSDYIPIEAQAQIATALNRTESEDDIRAVFEPWMMKGAMERWAGYP
jgi:HK97 family phage portal protein